MAIFLRGTLFEKFGIFQNKEDNLFCIPIGGVFIVSNPTKKSIKTLKINKITRVFLNMQKVILYMRDTKEVQKINCPLSAFFLVFQKYTFNKNSLMQNMKNVGGTFCRIFRKEHFANWLFSLFGLIFSINKNVLF